jgi:hypothetical protein
VCVLWGGGSLGARRGGWQQAVVQAFVKVCVCGGGGYLRLTGDGGERQQVVDEAVATVGVCGSGVCVLREGGGSDVVVTE